MVETTMRSMPVVVVKPGQKLSQALLGVLISTSVSPFAQSGLDETLGFAVGAWSIGTGEVVAQAELENSSPESVGAITVSVIGEQAADRNALCLSETPFWLKALTLLSRRLISCFIPCGP